MARKNFHSSFKRRIFSSICASPTVAFALLRESGTLFQPAPRYGFDVAAPLAFFDKGFDLREGPSFRSAWDTLERRRKDFVADVFTQRISRNVEKFGCLSFTDASDIVAVNFSLAHINYRASVTHPKSLRDAYIRRNLFIE
jgi:hypothetical protein